MRHVRASDATAEIPNLLDAVEHGETRGRLDNAQTFRALALLSELPHHD